MGFVHKRTNERTDERIELYTNKSNSCAQLKEMNGHTEIRIDEGLKRFREQGTHDNRIDEKTVEEIATTTPQIIKSAL